MSQHKETTYRLLDALIQLDDFCYLIGMSEEYHCQYPALIETLRGKKQSLAKGIEEGITPSGRLNVSRLAAAFPDDLAEWQTRISGTIDDLLPDTQHLLLPFPGKGIVEHSVDSAYQRLVQQQVNDKPEWLAHRIAQAPSVFSKMVLQHAFCDGLTDSSLNRRVLLHCAGLYDLLKATLRDNADGEIEEDLRVLHGALGFHAERVQVDVEEHTGGRITHLGYSSDGQADTSGLLTLSSDDPVALSHLIEMAAHQVSMPETPDIQRQLCSLADRLITLPAATPSIQLIADALAFRVAQMSSSTSIEPPTTSERASNAEHPRSPDPLVTVGA